MRFRICALVAIGCLCCGMFSGCWSYKGLDEMAIVSGIAIDKDQYTGKYLLTFEIINIRAHSNDGDFTANYVESEADSIFQAIRDCKRKVLDKLYGGNMQCLIVSKQVAEEDGMDIILEEMLRDAEPRETASIVISKEDTAKEILYADPLDSPIISHMIHNIIIEDNAITGSTRYMPLYQAYDALHGTGNSLVLPAVSCIQNNHDKIIQSDGIALFHDGHFIGFESPQDTMQYLFITDELKGSAIGLSLDGSDENIAMQIKTNHTNTQTEIQNHALHVSINMESKVILMETKSKIDVSSPEDRKKLEESIARMLEERILAYFSHVQTAYKTDIFSLGRTVYRKDPDLWRAIEKDWDEWFQTATVSVDCNVNILGAGVLKNY